MTDGVRRICIIGPECTGKTTLAQQLATHLNAAWVPEAARVYAERVRRELTAADVEPIAREHIATADAAMYRAMHRGASHLVLDTDLASTMVYARHYYGTCPPWIVDTARVRRASVYLLCDVDLPWTADGVRDRPSNREAMRETFRKTLEEIGASIVDVAGVDVARIEAAIAALRD